LEVGRFFLWKGLHGHVNLKPKEQEMKQLELKRRIEGLSQAQLGKLINYSG